MAVSVTHAKVSTVPPSADPDDVTTDDWNDPHTVTGAEEAGTAAAAVTAHEGAGDPHPTYETSAEAASKVSTHAGASDPHGDRAFATSAVGTHEADTTSVHGITNTASLETTTGSQAKVDAHEADTTSVHGITNTANLETTTGSQSKVDTHAAASDPHTGYLKESDFTGVDFLVGTATGITASEIAVGTTPGGELGGTWASPTVDATHSGSTHGAAVTTHEAASDPHTGYQLESELRFHVTFAKQGVVVTTTDSTALRWYNRTGRTLTFVMVELAAVTAPTGAAILVDVNVDGTTIFSTQSNRPTIAISGNEGNTTTFNTTTIADGAHYITVNVDQIGSTVAGSDLTVTVWMKG